MRRFCAIALLTLVASVAAADVLEVDTARRGDAVEVRATATLHATREIAWRVLTDYARYTEFLPDMQMSRVVSRSRGEVVVEQRGEFGFLWIRTPIRMTLAVTEYPLDAVASRMVSGTLLAFEGRYELQQTSEGLRLAYKGIMTLDPEQRSIFDTVAIRHSATRHFRALVAEIALRGAQGRREP